MIEQIKDIILKMSPDLWLYIGLGIVVAVFVIGLVLTLFLGQALKFKKAAKKFLKNPDAKNATVAAAEMPTKIKKLYKRTKATGEKPSDVISFDACVSWTFATSFASKFTKAVLGGAILAIPLVYGAFAVHNADIGVALFSVSAAGLVFALLAGIISALSFKGLTKVYNQYVDALDKLSRGGNYDEMPVETPIGQPENIMPVFDTPVEPIAQMSNDDRPEIHNDRFRTFEAPTKLNIEIEEENGVKAETVTQTQSSVLTELDEEIRREKEQRDEKAEEEARQREARAAALERAKAQAEERRKAAQQKSEAATQSSVVFSRPAEQNVIYSRPAEVPQNDEPPVVPAPEPQPVTPPAPEANSADVVIARIEQINREGASLATMKEVALLLQQERNKPENKTPEQQKKLNEALSSLLKSMSAASKR